jgi:hypothetical protein
MMDRMMEYLLASQEAMGGQNAGHKGQIEANQ